MHTTAEQLGAHLEATVIGPGDTPIQGVSGMDFATSNRVTFVIGEKHLADLHNSSAGTVIIDHCQTGLSMTQLVVNNVHKALIRALEFFAPQYPPPETGIDPLARVGKNVLLGNSVSIGPHVIIAEGCSIGSETVIGPGCKIGRNTKVGSRCRLDCNVVVYPDCHIGNHVIMQSNVVIGSTGFGYYFIDGAHQLIPHIGTVVVEDFVEIGANSCVDRAKFDSTRIGAGTKIDNLVQVGHNVTIGRCCVIAGMVGISGSCRIGDGVVIGGKTGFRDHINIGDGSMVGGGSMVWQDVPPGGKVFGYPARDQRMTLRIFSLVEHLPEMHNRLRHAEEEMQKLKDSLLLKA
jgi:UDP-3-O-[3-hydroxymyristoyl] glucosamine N-acyltransferase